MTPSAKARIAKSWALVAGLGISRRQRLAEMLQIPRSNWTTAQMRELIELLAQDATR